MVPVFSILAHTGPDFVSEGDMLIVRVVQIPLPITAGSHGPYGLHVLSDWARFKLLNANTGVPELRGRQLIIAERWR